MTTAFIASLQRSHGGVPKTPVERARVSADGMQGDWQQNRKHHGGPERALCLYSQELIDQLVLDGHPIFPGAVGENVTISGLDWRLMQPGVRIKLGEVEATITAFAIPCKTIIGAFADGKSTRISEKLFPGWSRVYARIDEPGELTAGLAVTLLP